MVRRERAPFLFGEAQPNRIHAFLKVPVRAKIAWSIPDGIRTIHSETIRRDMPFRPLIVNGDCAATRDPPSETTIR